MVARRHVDALGDQADRHATCKKVKMVFSLEHKGEALRAAERAFACFPTLLLR
jgi:hypothetical protein